MSSSSTSLLNRFLATSYVAFWTTIFVVRIVELVSLVYNRYPAVIIDSTHIHHFITGFVLLFVVLTLELFLEVNDAIKAVIFGIGLALISDEFLYWTLGRYNYWSYANCVGTLFFAVALLSAIYFTLESQLSEEPRYRDALRHAKDAGATGNPLISVVIPAQNEASFLGNALHSLHAQTYRNYEIIVVDNNSTDATAAIAAKSGARVMTETVPGVAAARQTGFMAARGAIIATTDADTVVPPHWLSNIAHAFAARPELVAYGGLYSFYSGPLSARLLFPDVAYLGWLVDRLLHRKWSLPGTNMAVRASAFHAVGGFDTKRRVMEDVDLSHRIASQGAVAFDYHHLVRTSGRRYQKGLIKGALPYAAETKLSKVIPKTIRGDFISIREEKYSRYNVLYPLIPAFVLIMIFALHGSAIRESHVTHPDTLKVETYVRTHADSDLSHLKK